SNAGQYDLFGFTTRISGDGNSLLVGAYGEDSTDAGVLNDSADNSGIDTGAIYLYARDGSSWSALRYIKASEPDSNDLFGWGLAVSADAATLAVGAQRESSAATAIAGDAKDNSAADAGAVYLY
ncbi:MAG: hypothetical protein HKO71_05840, partial [Pseudomonadales bacterium]|nr:hypothetical protein [Pseudomonadales bacterium]